MPKLGLSQFTKWEMTQEEELMGAVLTDLNKKMLQNLICRYSETKLNLKFTPDNLMQFTQEEAELAGQILILQHLIVLSEEAEQSLANLNEERKLQEKDDSLPSTYGSSFITPAGN